MRRIPIGISLVLFAFAAGALFWSAGLSRFIKPDSPEPLRLVLSRDRKPATPDFPVDHYIVTVENVSSRTVQGYSLGRTCE